MEEQNKSHKTLEVVWTRKNNMCNSKYIPPKMKEINIDDSCKKKKMLSNSKCYLQDLKMNENNIERAHKRVKKCLFQGNKNIDCNDETNLNKISDRLSEVPQISCTISPEIILKRKEQTPHDCVTNLNRSPKSLSEVSQISCTISPEIIPNRHRLRRKKQKLHDYGTNLNKSSDRLSKVPQISCTISPEIILKRKKQTLHDCVTNLNGSPKSLSEVSQISCTISPEIIPNRHRLRRKKQKLHDYVTILNKSPDRLSEMSQVLCSMSPQVISDQEKLIKKQENNFMLSNVDKLNASSFDKSKVDIKHTIKRVTWDLFEENQNKLDCDFVTNLKESSDSLSEVSLIPCTISPEIISNQKKLKRKQNDLIELKNVDKSNMSNKCDKIFTDSKCLMHKPKELNGESENVYIYLSEEQSKLSPVNLESSKVIYPFNKEELKNNKLNSNTNSKTIDYIKGSHADEFNMAGNNNNVIKLQNNKFKQITDISKSNNNEICSEINFDLLDIIESSVNTFKLKRSRMKPKKTPIEFKEKQNRSLINMFNMEDNVHEVPPLLYSKESVTETIRENLKTFEPDKTEHWNKDRSISLRHPSEITIIPATPEHDALEGVSAIEYSPETHRSSYIPLIEVVQSPKTPHNNNFHLLIQSDQSPSNMNTTVPAGFFETTTSPSQSFRKSKLPFNIDSIESPSNVIEDENCVSSEICRKKSYNSPSPNHYDSAKKRKKYCKNGLRGKFKELINRKKSEACIREYEKNLSKNHHSKPGETAVLKVIEAWKEFRTYVLLCYYMKSESEIQKVLVTLDYCPKNATKNSIIRIHSPWLTIESKITEIVLFVGVIHAEVIELCGSNKPLEPIGLDLFTNNIKGLSTTIFQSEVLWKCDCSKDTPCQCLGELSVYNYLQYMISH